jgi:hypothetical protein
VLFRSLGQLQGALKIGAIVTVGFAAHRALTRVLSDNVLSKITALQSGAGLTWRNTISGLIVAAAAIPVLAKVGGRQGSTVSAGVFASFVHSLVMTALTQANQPQAASYLSGFGANQFNREAPVTTLPYLRGYGEFFAPPGTSGIGEYYGAGQGSSISGLGAWSMAKDNPNLLAQAHAGYGAVTQAHAGYGTTMQAIAGGMGDAVLAEAAAGMPMGEYFAQGVTGIGDYEITPMTRMGYHGMGTDDGIRPDLHSAERALSVAEAAAGIGDIPPQSIWKPDQIAVPIGDQTDGTRSGVLEGRDGIFG